jgi:hypothetical protein
MVGFEQMRENEWGREEEDILQGENQYNIQDQAE